MMKKIYFDTCAIQRPLDDKSQLRIYLESEAVLALLRLIEESQIEWISSNILDFEIAYISDPIRNIMIQDILSLVSKTVQTTSTTKTLAEQIIQEGITALDAAHVAIAIEHKIDYFCTADDKLLKKIKKSAIVKSMRCLSPLELVEELT